MKNNLFAIAKITKATGLKGEVNIRPLIRQFNEYVDNDLYVGFDKNLTNDVKISNVSGSEKKPRFLFEGLTTRNDAEAMIGKCKVVSTYINAFVNGAELIIDVGVNAPGMKMSKGSRKKLNKLIEDIDGFKSVKLLSKNEAEFIMGDGSKKAIKF